MVPGNQLVAANRQAGQLTERARPGQVRPNELTDQGPPGSGRPAISSPSLRVTSTTPVAQSYRAPMALTPQSRLREVLLEVLQQAGGQLPRVDALQRMASALNGELTGDDLEPVPSRPQEANWQNRASFERAAMIRQGLLAARDDGIWSLVGSVGRTASTTARHRESIHCGQWQPRDSGECCVCGEPLADS